MGNRRFIHPETQSLAKILTDNVALRELMANMVKDGDSDGSQVCCWLVSVICNP